MDPEDPVEPLSHTSNKFDRKKYASRVPSGTTREQLKRVKVADLRTILNCLHSSKKTKKTSTPRMRKIQTIRRFISYQLTPCNAPTPVRLAVTRSLSTPSFSTGRIDGTKTRPKGSISVASSEEGPIVKRQSSKREEMKTPAKKANVYKKS